MSVNITIKDAVKKYGDLTVIKNLDLQIKEGEFFTLLGPSGCGKTTLLRMIAGFNSIENGEFYFNDQLINDVEPSKRNIGMVFQNYAIFPHMTVRKNVEFGLRMRNVEAQEVKKRADHFMKLVHIYDYADRKPDKLSGGQQQRIALARALVIEPSVLLMDEPLSNLDAKLRVEMRSIIKQIQNSVGITTVYVTHDQEEAMAVSDRIALMKEGVIQQVDVPKKLYQRPANTFVASFIGRSNFLSGELICQDQKVILHISDHNFEVKNIRPEEAYDRKVIISVRPEEFLISKDGISAKIEESIFLGINTHYFIDIEGQVKDSENRFVVIEESKSDEDTIQQGEIKIDLNLAKINIFSEDGSKNLIG